MFRRVVLPLMVAVLLPACAATSMMKGVREPKLTSLNVGDTRAQVERMLGKRLWRPGSADGLTYDIYQYKAGQPAAPGAGVIALAFDTLTLGLTELDFRDGLKFAPLKQVAVATTNRITSGSCHSRGRCQKERSAPAPGRAPSCRATLAFPRRPSRPQRFTR
jgi:hypothetical protein